MCRIFAEIFPVPSADGRAVDVYARTKLHIHATGTRLLAQSIAKLIDQVAIPRCPQCGQGGEGGCGFITVFPAKTLHIRAYCAGVIAHLKLFRNADARDSAYSKRTATMTETDFVFER